MEDSFIGCCLINTNCEKKNISFFFLENFLRRRKSYLLATGWVLPRPKRSRILLIVHENTRAHCTIYTQRVLPIANGNDNRSFALGPNSDRMAGLLYNFKLTLSQHKSIYCTWMDWEVMILISPTQYPIFYINFVSNVRNCFPTFHYRPRKRMYIIFLSVPFTTLYRL